jgi:cytochrome c biogenesis protein CcmG/thiol:disulfide interchange protein DsbE
MKRLLISLAVVGALWGLTLVLQNEGPGDIKESQGEESKGEQETIEVGPRVGFKAADFELMALDKQKFSLKQWEGDKPVVINFWASWCGPCRLETPDLVKLHEQYKDEVVFYGLNLTSGDTVNEVKKFAKEFSITYPILLDVTGQVASDYAVQAVPTTLFIGKNGVIVDKIIGLASASEIERRIKKLTESTP